MAEFQATPDDLHELIRSRQRAEARRQAPYPLGAAAVALLLLPVYLPAALVALGMCIAWSLSTYWSIRGLAAAYQWRYAWLQEPIVVEVLEEWRWSGKTVPRWSLKTVPPLGGAPDLGAEP